MQIDKRHIKEYLEDPTLVADLPLDSIEQAVEQYPWAPELRAIHARKLLLDQHKDYEQVLATASLYAADRVWLKQYVESDLTGQQNISKTLEEASEIVVQNSRNAGEEDSRNAREEDSRNAREEDSRNAGEEEKGKGKKEDGKIGRSENDKVEEKKKATKPKKKTKKESIKIAPLDTEEKADIDEEVNLEAAKTAHQESKIRDLDTSGTDSFLGWLGRVSGDIKKHDAASDEKTGEQDSRNAGEQDSRSEGEEEKEKAGVEMGGSEDAEVESANQQISKSSNLAGGGLNSDIDSAMEKFIAAQKALKSRNPEVEKPAPEHESVGESIKEQMEVVSEGMAKLLANQGKTDKAIAMYKKLQLKYPEKSTFFAARIEEIQKNAS